MPQHQQRARRRLSSPSAAAPYIKRQRMITDRCCVDHINTILPDDALTAVFAWLPGTADVVRCAATCMRWRRVVATNAAALSRSLPPLVGRFLPQLSVGVFHLEKDGPTARTRSAPGVPQPWFLAMASGIRLLPGCRYQQITCMIGSLFGDITAGIFDYSRPVASRSGRLVLELRRERRAGGVITFCVCNPMTGDVVVLPALVGTDKNPITEYGCALLTGDDLRPRRGDSKFFQLLLVYNNRRQDGLTALRCYSSDTGRWGPEARSAVTVSSRELRHIGPAVAVHGAAFWALDHGALAVCPPAVADEMTMEAHLLPYDVPHSCPTNRLLGVSPDGRLFLVHFGLVAVHYVVIVKISYFDIPGGDIKTGKKERSSLEERIRVYQMKMTGPDRTLRLRWAGERSGVVLFTMGGGGGHTGAFALNLREGTVEKLADAEGRAHAWGNCVGFEMDWAAYLASMDCSYAKK